MFPEFCACLSLLKEQLLYEIIRNAEGKKKHVKGNYKKYWKTLRTRVTENWHMETKHLLQNAYFCEILNMTWKLKQTVQLFNASRGLSLNVH